MNQKRNLLAALVIMLTVSVFAISAQTNPPTAQTNAPVGTNTAFTSINALTVKLDPDTLNLLKSLNEDHWFRKDVMVSTIVGGALAIIGGFLAAMCADKLQERQKRRDDKQFSKNVLRAIRRELEAIGDVYKNGIGAKLNEVGEGQFFPFRLGLTQDWFSVFHANAIHLGRIDSDISRQIVTVYIHSKQLIEEFRLNNEVLAIRATLFARLQSAPGDVLIPGQIEFAERELVQKAALLKQIAAKLDSATVALLACLDECGIK